MTPPFDPVAAAVAELKAVTGMPAVYGDDPDPGVMLGPGHYVQWIRVRVLEGPPVPRTPVRKVVLGIQAYDLTEAAARQLGWAVEAVFRDVGARCAASGLGIWHSTIGASGPDVDPDTKQPYWQIVVNYPTTIAAVRTP